MALPSHTQPPASCAPAALSAAPTPAPSTYVPLPRRLLEDLRDSPAAVGAYALIGRLSQITGEAVPLSAGDLQAYDPALTYGAARRALDRLVGSGYALAEAAGGRKQAFHPTWGTVHSAPVPWSRTSPSLGRPRHVTAIRLSDRLLDLCLGRLRPHKVHRAVVERYLTAPLLGLREVGAYALALAGLPVTSPTLVALGLLDAHGSPLPLPDDHTILTVVAPRLGKGALTPTGERRLGLAGGTTTEASHVAPEDVIGPMIGQVIGHLIAPRVETDTAEGASERQGPPLSSVPAGSHGSDGDHGASTTQHTPGETTHAGGGGRSITLPNHTARRQCARNNVVADSTPHRATTTSMPTNQHVAPEESESLRLLRGLGVRADVATGLAIRPAAQIARVIALVRARQGVRDPAAWVVSALRALPEVEPEAETANERPPSAMPIHTHPGLSDEQRDRWIKRFRAAPTPHEQRAILVRLEQEHPR